MPVFLRFTVATALGLLAFKGGASLFGFANDPNLNRMVTILLSLFVISEFLLIGREWLAPLG